MSSAVEDILAALDDPALWVIGPERNVFDEHEEKKEDGTLERFDKARLERIAANCNARDAKGQPCPATLGHTIDGAPETQQPFIAGYFRYFRVVWDDRLHKWVIRAKPYIRREKADEAAEYPRTSVERWPDDDFFDPIALVRRTPRLDVGQWTYGRPTNERRRYTLENENVPDQPNVDKATMPDDYGKFCAHAEKYMAEKFPHLGKMHEKYAADEAQSKATSPGLGNPTEPPRAPAPESDAVRMARESEALRYQKLEGQIVAERYARRKAEAERAIVQLEAEGFRLNRNTEVERMAGMTDKGQREREKEIRENYQRAPVSRGNDFVLATTAQGPGGSKAMDRDSYERAKQYQRDKKCSWEEALAHETGIPAS